MMNGVMMERNDRLLQLSLRCPQCRIELEGIGTDTRTCPSCREEWQMQGGKWHFDGADSVFSLDATDSLKSRLKMGPRLYAAAVYVLSPVYPQWFFESRRLRKSLPGKALVVDVGAGNSRWSESTINVDLMPYPNVNVVAQADCLPFATDSVDVVTTIAMLEHVPDPWAACSEINRILRVGGKAYVYVPFIQGFHAAPHDYQRFTRPGLEVALAGFEIERCENFGPTSGLIWIVAEWLSIVLSFGSRGLQRSLAMVFMTVLSPIKFLDAALRHFPGSENIATGFLLVGRKVQAAGHG